MDRYHNNVILQQIILLEHLTEVLKLKVLRLQKRLPQFFNSQQSYFCCRLASLVMIKRNSRPTVALNRAHSCRASWLTMLDGVTSSFIGVLQDGFEVWGAGDTLAWGISLLMTVTGQINEYSIRNAVQLRCHREGDNIYK